MSKQMARFLAMVCLGLVTAATAVQAHFNLNQNVRIHHVAHDDDGLDVYLRIPLAFVLADLVGPEGPDGLPQPAPFTTNRIEDGALVHYLDPAQLRQDPDGLAHLASGSLVLTTDDAKRAPRRAGIRLSPLGSEPGFATLAEARSALASPAIFPDAAGPAYVGDVMVDLHLRFAGGPVDTYTLSHKADPGLPGQEDTANLILDYRGDTVRTYRATGLMHDPVRISGTARAAAGSFVVEGVRHILEGPDHLLFVICMIIGAARLQGLLVRITGFTIGHTATLVAGFFGFAPAVAWFVPAIELAIALSIIFAALLAVMPTRRKTHDGKAFAVTLGVGLLHGFGFSFMLHRILQVDSPNVWHSLLAFNVGVEIGQLIIVLLVWPLVLVLRHQPRPVRVGSRALVAATAGSVAMFWVVERAEFLL